MFLSLLVSRYVFVSQGVYRDTYRIVTPRIVAALVLSDYEWMLRLTETDILLVTLISDTPAPNQVNHFVIIDD